MCCMCVCARVSCNWTGAGRPGDCSGGIHTLGQRKRTVGWLESEETETRRQKTQSRQPIACAHVPVEEFAEGHAIDCAVRQRFRDLLSGRNIAHAVAAVDALLAMLRVGRGGKAAVVIVPRGGSDHPRRARRAGGVQRAALLAADVTASPLALIVHLIKKRVASRSER